MKPALYALVAVALALSLGGCAGQVLAYGQEAASAAKDRVDEETDYREDLRALKRQINDEKIRMLLDVATMARQEGDTETAMEMYDRAIAQVEAVYPDLTDVVEDLRRFNRAVEGDE